MLCVNKLINLVFNVKKINAKKQFASFKKKTKQKLKTKKKQKQKNKHNPRIKCMNIMQYKSQKQRKQKPKDNGHKEQSSKAQGSYQCC